MPGPVPPGVTYRILSHWAVKEIEVKAENNTNKLTRISDFIWGDFELVKLVRKWLKQLRF